MIRINFIATKSFSVERIMDLEEVLDFFVTQDNFEDFRQGMIALIDRNDCDDWEFDEDENGDIIGCPIHTDYDLNSKVQNVIAQHFGPEHSVWEEIADATAEYEIENFETESYVEKVEGIEVEYSD